MKKLLLGLVLLIAALVTFDFAAPHTAAHYGLALEHARTGLEVKRASIPGFEIAYLEGGPANGEPLILIHGFGADKDNFTRVSAYLTKRYRVIIPDLPGFGDSSKPDNVTYTIPEQVERVRAFAQGLGISRAHFGGSSMGGWIAAAYAVKYPNEVGSLWLLGPAGTQAAFEGSDLSMTIAETRENPLLAKTPEEFPAIMDFVMSKPPFFPYSIKRVLGERAAADYPLHKKIFDQLNAPQTPSPILDEQIKGLATPTLLVWGKEDRALNYKASETYKALMPNAQVILMDGIGHLPMLEATKPVAEDYLKFRNGLAEKPAGT